MTSLPAPARQRPRLAEAFVPVGSVALLVGMLALVLASAHAHQKPDDTPIGRLAARPVALRER